jgi:hypothetical protein
MYTFTFASNWAEIMTGQLVAFRGYPDPAYWGYACLCVGNRFEAVLSECYLDIDLYTGEYLHVFSLFPPPLQLVDARIKAMMKINDPAVEPSLVHLQRLRKNLISQNPKEDGGRMKGILRNERNLILKALKDANVGVDASTDFIFFDFRSLVATRHRDIDIDVVAAMQSPMGKKEDVSKYVEFFQGMGTLAKDSFGQGHGVQQFVNRLQLRWSARISLNKIGSIRQYIGFFGKALGRT